MSWYKQSSSKKNPTGKQPKILMVRSHGMWGINQKDLDPLKKISSFRDIEVKNLEEKKLAEMCEGVDHLLFNIDGIKPSEERMERISEVFWRHPAVKNLKSMNVDMSDLDYFNPLIGKKYCPNIIFQSVPNDYGNCAVADNVAESAISEILLHAKGRHLDYLKQDSGCRGIRLNGQYAGVVGCGRIGSRVAKKLEGLGMKVLRNDIESGKGTDSITDIFKNCKVISIHVPTVLGSGKSNVDLINQKLIGLSKGAILINLATDRIVNADAAKNGLKNGNLLGYSCEQNYGSPVWAEKNYLNKLKGIESFHMSPCSSNVGSSEVNIQMKTGWISNTVSVINGNPQNICN